MPDSVSVSGRVESDTGTSGGTSDGTSSSAAAVAVAPEKREQARPSVSPVAVPCAGAGTWSTASANSVRTASVPARRPSSGIRAGKSPDAARPHSPQGPSWRTAPASARPPMATARRRGRAHAR